MGEELNLTTRSLMGSDSDAVDARSLDAELENLQKLLADLQEDELRHLQEDGDVTKLLANCSRQQPLLLSSASDDFDRADYTSRRPTVTVSAPTVSGDDVIDSEEEELPEILPRPSKPALPQASLKPSNAKSAAGGASLVHSVVQQKNLKNKRATRRENLSRLSTSCPSLDVDWRSGGRGAYQSSLDVTQEEDEDTVAAAAESPKERSRPLSLYSQSTSRTDNSSSTTYKDVTSSMGDGQGGSSSSLEERLKHATNGSDEDSEELTEGEDFACDSSSDKLTELSSSSIAEPGSWDRRGALATHNCHRASVSATSDAPKFPDVQANRRSSLIPTSALTVAKKGAAKLFSLDKSRSMSTPSINAAGGIPTGDKRQEVTLSHQAEKFAVKLETEWSGSSSIKRRSSLFAHLSSHHEEDPSKKPSGSRRLSLVLGMLGGHRKDKESTKEQKKSAHSFVPVPGSDAICDMCGKPVKGKQVLQCTNCLLYVHESCKDTTGFPCAKQKWDHKTSSLMQPTRRVSSVPYTARERGALKMRTSLSANALLGRAQQGTPLVTLSGELTLQRQDVDDASLISSNMASSFPAGSTGSLAVAGGADDSVELDPELVEIKPEPESWSETIDKKLMKKLSAKYIQRQDNIWEFIATEKHYVRALKTVQTIYAKGMVNYCNYPAEVIARLFPGLDSLVEMHTGFLERLHHRQTERADKSIDVIGDILLEQFGGYLGAHLKETYGKFVSRQREAVEYYKELAKTDKRFQGFIKRCLENPNTKRRSMLDLMAVTTQRMPKYKVLLDQMIKNSKDSKDKFDKDNLTKALECNRKILQHIDQASELRNKELRLIDIYNKTDVRSMAAHEESLMFKKSDFLANGRKLRHEGILTCRSNSREKEVDVLVVLLSDVLVFLQENNQKYSFFSHDSKPFVIPIAGMLVHEKGNSKDNRTFFVMMHSPTRSGEGRSGETPIELVCKTPVERRDWVDRLLNAVQDTGDDDSVAGSDGIDGATSSKALEVLAKVNEIVEGLRVKDEELDSLGKERANALRDLLVEYTRVDTTGEIAESTISSYHEDNEFGQAVYLLRTALTEVMRLSSAYSTEPMFSAPAAPLVGEMLMPASQVAAHSQHKAAAASAAAVPTSPTTGHESFFGSFMRTRRLGHSVEDVRIATGGSQSQSSNGGPMPDSDGDSGPPPPPTKSQWVKKWGKDGDAHDHEPRSRASSVVVTQDSKKAAPIMQQFPVPAPSSTHGVSSLLLSNNEDQPLSNIEHLSEYLHAILLITNKQDATISNYKRRVEEANVRISELSQEAERTAQERKNAFRHNKQMEEIRSISEQIAAERQRWEQDKQTARLRCEEERLRLEGLKRDQDLEQEAIRTEAKELMLQRESLQQQLDLHFQGKRAVSLPVVVVGGALPQRTDVAATLAVTREDALVANSVGQHERSLSADAKADAGIATAVPSTEGHHSPRWNSPMPQQKRPKQKGHSSMTAVDVGTASTASTAGGDKKRILSKR